MPKKFWQTAVTLIAVAILANAAGVLAQEAQPITYNSYNGDPTPPRLRREDRRHVERGASRHAGDALHHRP
ncbi:MAG: hypothetical protein M5R40_12930 [Anaerolineae bacterium]|nr:hypothetical protein [Anaerolineae bacterium]